MKKATIFFCLILSFCFSKAQQSFLFKIKYLPGHIYESAITSNMTMEINFSGDSVTMEKIKQKGMQLPMKIISGSQMDVEAKTQSVASDNTFPIVITYKNIITKKEQNGVEKEDSPNPLLGQKIYGKYTIDGKITIDSITGKTLDDHVKNVIEKSVANLSNQIKFPEKPMKIDESFTQEVPFNLPLGGINMNMSIKVIYTLKSIENNLAYFYIDESLKFDVSNENDNTDMKGDGSGKGSGKLVYDINKNFPISYNTNLGFIFNVITGPLSISANATMTSEHKTKISQAN